MLVSIIGYTFKAQNQSERNIWMMKQCQCGTFPGDRVHQLKQCGKRGMEIHGPYRGAVMVLMDRVEQRVRSPQHLCGRLMTAEPKGVGGGIHQNGEKLGKRPQR